MGPIYIPTHNVGGTPPFFLSYIHHLPATPLREALMLLRGDWHLLYRFSWDASLKSRFQGSTLTSLRLRC